MAPKSLTSVVFFLLVNLLFFNLTAATIFDPIESPTCPLNSLKIRACAKVLNLANLEAGTRNALHPCCSVIDGLLDLEAAVCLCTSLRLSLLGIHLNLPVHLSLAINACNGNIPRGFQCPPSLN